MGTWQWSVALCWWLGTSLVALARNEGFRPCADLSANLPRTCWCGLDGDTGIEMDCDGVVFGGDFPVLPYKAPIHSFSQRNSGHQNLPTQAFTASDLPLKRLDFSHNSLRRLTDRLLVGVEGTLEELRLAENLLGDHLNPIFSTSEFHGLEQLRILDLRGNAIKGVEEGILRGCQSLQELYLDRNSLPEVPSSSLNGPKGLHILSLSHNKIGAIKNQAFLSQRQLQRIDLSNNWISGIEGRAFTGLQRLRELRLARNRLTKLNSDAFQGADNMESLNLAENFLAEVPIIALKVLHNIKHLNLSSNLIQTVENGNLESLPSLETMDLSRNNIGSIAPGTFLGLRHLKHLDISVNALRTVEDDAFEGLDNLERLFLQDNNILFVPASALGRLPRLRSLHLDYNRIAAVSSDILKFVSHIQQLSLARNVIRELPAATFLNFSQLVELDLHGNQIQKLMPDTFGGLEGSLEKLDLSQNKISVIAKFALLKLRELNLAHNDLKQLPEDIFSLLPSLNHLNLSHNPSIIELSTNSFHGLNMLTSLDLTNTGLKILPSEFISSPVLREVHLKDNSIIEVPDRAFSFLPNLTTIDLSNNKILNIRSGAFDAVPLLRKINLSGNQLNSFKGEFFRGTNHSFVEELDLSRNEITYLFPTFQAHSKLRKLNLSKNRFTFFPSDLISHMQFLEYLNLDGNSLKNIEDMDFARLPRLSNLILSNNQLEYISETAFQNSTQLQFVDLSHNKLEKLFEHTFEGLSRLNLNLENNLLYDLPESIFDRARLHMLENINLADNRFETPPLKQLQRQYFFLTSVDLSRNKIKDVPADDILVNIKKLDISFNPLTEEAVRNILNEPKTVRELNMASTGVTQVPPLETPFLRHLNLSMNSISQLPDSIFERPTLLEVLDVSQNKLSDLTSLTSTWSQLKNLHTLDISKNPITTIIQGDFKSLDNLQSLRINNLELCIRLEKNAFKSLKNLAELSAYGYPRLGYLDVKGILESFDTLEKVDIELKDAAVSDQLMPALLPRLKALTIRGTRIRSISSSALAGLNSPTIAIRIQNTSVSSLPPAAFFPIPKSSKITLDLSGNKLSSLNPQVLSAFDNRRGDLTITGLDANPILCDCSVKALRRWLLQKPFIGSQVRCMQPDNLSGQLLKDVADQDLICGSRTSPQAKTTTSQRISSTNYLSTTTEFVEPDIIWSVPPTAQTKEPKPTKGKTTGLNNDDTLIIGIVGGVVAFIAILIIVICIIRLRIANNQYRGGPLAGAVAIRNQGKCTCVKPPLHQPVYLSPYPAATYANTLPPKMLPPPQTPMSIQGSYSTLGRQHYYPNPPYYVTFPPEEAEAR